MEPLKDGVLIPCDLTAVGAEVSPAPPTELNGLHPVPLGPFVHDHLEMGVSLGCRLGQGVPLSWEPAPASVTPLQVEMGLVAESTKDKLMCNYVMCNINHMGYN